MDGSTGEVLTFVGSAPFIALFISFFLKPVLGDRFMNARTIPIICVAITAAWGGVLALSGLYDGSPAEFVAVTVSIAASASGMRSWVLGVRKD